MNKKTDYIMSKTNKTVYLKIVYEEKANIAGKSYKGEILKGKFPEDIMDLLSEFNELADSGTFTLIDNIVDKINELNLCLKYKNRSISNLRLDGCVIYFSINEIEK